MRTLQDIIHTGIMENRHTLMMGGHVSEAGRGSGTGFTIQWNTDRHPLTERLRRNKGLGIVTPMLYFTSFLEDAYEMPGKVYKGSVSTTRADASATSFYWTPSTSKANRLMLVHEQGGPRLTGRKGNDPGYGPGFRIPARPAIFWSQSMAQKVRDLAASNIRRKAMSQPVVFGPDLPPGFSPSAQAAYTSSRSTSA